MQEEVIIVKGLKDPRPEFAITEKAGAISTYPALKPAPWGDYTLMRVFACHQKEFALLHLATFYTN